MYKNRYLLPKRQENKYNDKHTFVSYNNKYVLNDSIRNDHFTQQEFQKSNQNTSKNTKQPISRMHSEKAINSFNFLSSRNCQPTEVFSLNYTGISNKNQQNFPTAHRFYKTNNHNVMPRNSKEKNLYSQRLEMTGNLYLQRNPSTQFVKNNSQANFRQYDSKSKLRTCLFTGQEKMKLNTTQSKLSFQQSNSSKKIRPAQLSKQKYSKFNATSTSFLQKYRSRTIFSKEKQRYDIEQESKDFKSSTNKTDIQRISLTDKEQQTIMTKKSQASLFRNNNSEINLSVHLNNNNKKNKIEPKQTNYAFLGSKNRLSCNFQLKGLLKQKNHLQEKLFSLQAKFIEKQQRINILQRQLQRQKKIRKQHTIQQTKKCENIQAKQHELQKKCLRNEILLLKMANKKYQMYQEAHNQQVVELRKKLKQLKRNQLENSQEIKYQQYLIKNVKNSRFQGDQDKNSVVVRSDLENDFDPLDGLSFDLNTGKDQNQHLLQLLTKAERQLQILRSHNRELRQQNDNYLSIIRKEFQVDNIQDFKIKGQKDKIVQCYKEVLKLFNISLQDYQIQLCHAELIKRIKHKSKLAQNKKLISLLDQKKVKKTEQSQIEALFLENEKPGIRPLFKKQDIQGLFSRLNQKIQNLQPQLDNKFNDLIQRLNKVIKILGKKFDSTIHDTFVNLVRDDEVLAQYVEYCV